MTDLSPPDPRSSRMRAAAILDRLWPFGPVLALGLAAGFWAADRGLRWLPDMAQVLLAVWSLSIALAFAGVRLARLHLHLTPKGLRQRRRVVALLVLSLLGFLAWAGTGLVQRDTPLTALSPEAFVGVFTQDANTYVEMERGLAATVHLIASEPALAADRPLSADEERRLLDAWARALDYAVALDQLRMDYEVWYRFDASRVERPSLLRSFLLTYAAELALFDHGGRLTTLLRANPNARKFLDTAHPAHGLPAHTFSRFSQDVEGTRDQGRALGGAQYLAGVDRLLGWRRDAAQIGLLWLWTDVDDRLAKLADRGLLDRARMTLAGDGQLLKRAFRRTWMPTQRTVAEFFGDTKFRRVGTYLITPEQQEELDLLLEPGDVLLTRKNWYLSNIGLPGWWPHAILYLGSPEKLAAWADDPAIHELVRERLGVVGTFADLMTQAHAHHWLVYSLGDGEEPYRLLEAHKPGVELTTLRESSGDALVALRPRLDKRARAQALLEAFRHVGKPYDFDFDFATDHALVCTEVVWRAYRPAEGKLGIELPVIDVAGRKALPANEIARAYVRDRGTAQALFDFVAFIDVHEEEGRSVVATEADFLTTPDRAKWSPFKGE